MRGLKFALILMTAVAGLLAAPPAHAEGGSHILGVWRNPKDTVHVDLRPCGGDYICGYVVWASAKAQADARKRGTANMIGLQVLKNMTPVQEGLWKGKVFAPELGMTFSGTAELLEAASMRAKGCVIGAFLCKSQVWRRVDFHAAG